MTNIPQHIIQLKEKNRLCKCEVAPTLNKQQHKNLGFCSNKYQYIISLVYDTITYHTTKRGKKTDFVNVKWLPL
jgi:hypothetical protein